MRFTEEHTSSAAPSATSSRRRSIRTSTRGTRRRVPGARGVQEGGSARPARRQQARGVRRHGPRLLVSDGRRPRSSAPATAARSRWRSASRPTWRRPRSRAGARDELKQEFLAPAIAGEVVRVDRGQRSLRRLRRRGDQDDRAQGRQRLRDQRLEDVDHERGAGRLAVPARQHERGRGPREQDARDRADQDQGRRRSARRSTSSACARATPARSSSRTSACRSATASAKRAWAS